MFDQSFSVENFRKILDYENKKGNFVEGKFFSDVIRILTNIKRLNRFINNKRSKLTADEFGQLQQRVEATKDKLKNEREELLTSELSKLSEKVSTGKFRILLKRNDNILHKSVYTTEDNPEFFFVLKQVQHNFKRLYKVKQSNRYLIVIQIRNLVDDHLPKILVRTDIENFYENIPHDKLLEKLNEENLLSYSSKAVIRQIINQYKILSGSDKGLPRGIGISAYLAEVYMRNFDKAVTSLPNVSYYARYVDDIFIVFLPNPALYIKNYVEYLRDIVQAKTSLFLNATKTGEFDLTKQRTCVSFDYLGYNFSIDKTEKETKISLGLTNDKIAGYKRKIDAVLRNYLASSKKNEKASRILLLKRIRFLTGNTRLVNNKSKILVGVYFTHSLATNNSDFKLLDNYLVSEVNRLIINPFLLKKILRNKFIDGFELKRFSSFKPFELSKIVEAWN